MRTIVSICCFVLPVCMVFAQDSKENSPYVFPSFQIGTVYLSSGDSTRRSMNYNGATEELVYDQRGQLLALDNLNLIRSVIIGENVFVPFNGKFYQKIGEQGLFITYKYKVVPPSAPSAYGGESNTTASTNWLSLSNRSLLYTLSLPTEYKIIKSKEFLLYKDNQFFKVNRLSQVSKLFPEKASALKTFIKTNNLDWSRITDVVEIISFCHDTTGKK